MKRSIAPVAIAMLALAPFENSRAGVIYNTQVRTVSANVTAIYQGGTPATDSESLAALDFQPFSGTASAFADTTPGPGFGTTGSASASQNSTLGALGFSAMGSAAAQLGSDHMASASGSATANSRFEVEFVTDSPMQLQGSLRGGFFLNRRVTAELFSNGSMIVGWSATNSTIPINFALAPGTYTFIAIAPNMSNVGTLPETTTYNVTLTPEPASFVLLLAGMGMARLGGRRLG